MSKKLETRYGIINNTRLEVGDYGLVLLLDIELQDSGNITFGNIHIAKENEPFVDRESEYYKMGVSNFAGYFITKVFDTVGSRTLEGMIGKPIRVLINDNLCVGIQNFLNSRKFFIPRLDFEPTLYDTKEILPY